MNGPKPEWYDKLKAGPFTRKTFTMDDIYRIEQKTAECAQGGRVPKLTVPKRRRTLPVLAAVFLCVAAAAFLFRGELEPAVTKAWSGFVKPTEPPQATVPPLQDSKSYTYLKGDTYSLPGPDETSSYGSDPFLVSSDRPVKIRDQKNGFIQVNNDRWIPEWFVLKESDKLLEGTELNEFLKKRPVVNVSPYYRIVKDSLNFSLYPGEDKPSGFLLKKGRVVKVIREYENWLCVRVMYTDGLEYNGDVWVPKSELTVYEPSKAREGLLKNRAIATDSTGQTVYVTEGSPILVEDLSENKYTFTAFRDLKGTLFKSDFLANPFEGKDQIPQVDYQWYFSKRETFKNFDVFTKTRTDDQLKGLEPIDIFRFYVMAAEKGDWETVYALLIKGSDYATPGREEYLSDIGKEPDADKQAKKKWDALRKDYTLYQEISGDSAYIVMTKRGSGSSSSEDKQAFSLIRNKAGIWKVSWLPMQ
ncbi:hypothetical protein [Paenibacillus chitinolyticus]|uniref:hypothetical protein n=1 Tax=Paenibacillus chitinolyticus TaxID=79263 RepID=UPI003D0440AC